MGPYGSLGADIEFLEISKPGRPSHTQLDLEIWKSRKITLRAQISRNGPKFPEMVPASEIFLLCHAWCARRVCPVATNSMWPVAFCFSFLLREAFPFRSDLEDPIRLSWPYQWVSPSPPRQLSQKYPEKKLRCLETLLPIILASPWVSQTIISIL